MKNIKDIENTLNGNLEEYSIQISDIEGNSTGNILLNIQSIQLLTEFLIKTEKQLKTKTEFYNGNNILITLSNHIVYYISDDGISIHASLNNLKDHFELPIPAVFGLNSRFYKGKNAIRFYEQDIESLINKNKSKAIYTELLRKLENFK